MLCQMDYQRGHFFFHTCDAALTTQLIPVCIHCVAVSYPTQLSATYNVQIINDAAQALSMLYPLTSLFFFY